MTHALGDMLFFANFLSALFGWLMGFLGIFLILLVLVQRGRGGGLTGALGGPGGQSAFGSKAGDMFTRVTFAVAGVWIFICAAAMWSLGDARTAGAKIDPPSIRESGTDFNLNPLQSGEDPATGSSLGIELPSDLGASDLGASDLGASEGLNSVEPAAPETPAEATADDGTP